jgi:8-oxo-dGTP pyrophosphatase MutT (NUDIX family)
MELDDRAIRIALDPASPEWHTEPGLRDAAILVPIVRRVHGDTLVFTQRRSDLAAHAGQVSFPGGGREGDEDPVACAVRETEEEIGIGAASLDVLGRLPDRISIAGFRVAAFVARVRDEPQYRPLESEVAEVFELPFAGMLAAERWSIRPSKSDRVRFPRIPYLDLEGRTVWGLTGIILRDFVRRASSFDPGE